MTDVKRVKKHKLVKSWVQRHIHDKYVNLSKLDNYRSRAAYKLLEIDEKYKIFDSTVKVVIDLGCSPGSWLQVVLEKFRDSSEIKIIGIDLNYMDELPNVGFINGDFTKEEVYINLINILGDNKVDLLLSDMSPNLSGIRTIDQAKMATLVETVLDFAINYLSYNGNSVIKMFYGSDFNSLVTQAKEIFEKVIIFKPKSSRSESNEVYLICKNKK